MSLSEKELTPALSENGRSLSLVEMQTMLNATIETSKAAIKVLSDELKRSEAILKAINKQLKD